MPTYEYRCAHCDKTFDVVQSFQDDPLTSCPTCGSPVKKVFGNVGIVFKGSGFYKTDSRTAGGGKKDKDKDKDSSPSSGDTSTTGSDTKPTPPAGDTKGSPAPASPPVRSAESKPSGGSKEKAAKAPTSG